MIFFLCEKIVIFLCGSIVMELVQGGSLFQIVHGERGESYEQVSKLWIFCFPLPFPPPLPPQEMCRMPSTGYARCAMLFF